MVFHSLRQRIVASLGLPIFIGFAPLLSGSTPLGTQQEGLRNPPNPADLEGWEIYPPGQLPPDFASPSPSQSVSPSTSDVVPFAVARPATNVPTFTVTIVKRPITLIFYDAGTAPGDGDAVRIAFNGQTVKNVLPLTISGTVVQFPANLFRPGVNRIAITALGSGAIPLNTVGMIFPSTQVGNGNRRDIQFAITSGQTIGTTVGFPQIALCRTRFRFPCVASRSLSVFPESAQHVLEAQGIPPQPIVAPLRPGRTGNPLRRSYPRLLTVDRPNSTTRRNQSIAAYRTCPPKPNGTTQDRDEYPPAVFLENGVPNNSGVYVGSAHIKCIASRDNQLSGSSFGSQLNFYRERPNATPYAIDNQDTIEFVILD
ncbi:hypothetical protein [Chroogloeocystis siderophila]|jgi:hypothetical protein|uniref:Uncharacterized protein n=1 Tax=Chroogloeocystis siderophila 5.2 s.c.1 TaxID=247279 RepID=A0A1U7HK38_9CHRO|nr:hypothetical protein [Chroogloeocystis siderophila]OKH23924.1 hypothetical protein NIES1031_16640 [Chroogloeocystis siderophila 5.2 s.c.1]